ncbi:hypothetical protein PTQ27_07870 [Mannheimia sp. AT1]|uniref:Uncharacterized protein n=1 Tax=Mannheimia cairinae TaxID=3025936 RepID=A0ABT5MU38_9PAST|nr:hypothetical protein [Mannheimia cairinae]MDD0824378.1 hypothetical protein [Mannheimia cairinae]MDD0826499.1 hypothetical protein [Mannheimia cairinae]
MLKFFDTVFLIVGAIVLASLTMGLAFYGLIAFSNIVGIFILGIVITISLLYLVKLTKNSAQFNQTPSKLLQASNPTLRKMQNKIWDSFRLESNKDKSR